MEILAVFHIQKLVPLEMNKFPWGGDLHGRNLIPGKIRVPRKDPLAARLEDNDVTFLAVVDLRNSVFI